jgi:hypothetical protein
MVVTARKPTRARPYTKRSDALSRALRFVDANYNGDVARFFREIKERDAKTAPKQRLVDVAAIVNRCQGR